MTSLFESRDRAVKAADKLKVYAQPQRLMILSCLLRGERTVSEIDAATGIGQPALSQQLAELRRNYDMLLLKVLSLLQDSDPPLARDIVKSRAAIWSILEDPRKFTESNLMAGATP